MVRVLAYLHPLSSTSDESIWYGNLYPYGKFFSGWFSHLHFSLQLLLMDKGTWADSLNTLPLLLYYPSLLHLSCLFSRKLFQIYNYSNDLIFLLCTYSLKCLIFFLFPKCSFCIVCYPYFIGTSFISLRKCLIFFKTFSK